MATTDRELAELTHLRGTQKLDPFKGVKKLPLEEFFTSGHRTCQGCESALVMKLMVKAAARGRSCWAAPGACTWRTPRITAPRGSCPGCTRSSAPPARRRWAR